MSDDVQTSEEAADSAAPDSAAPSIFNQPGDGDWLLAWIVSLAEKGLSLSITVSAGGQLITGLVIGGREYFELMGSLVKSANYNIVGAKETLANGLAQGFAGWKEFYPKAEDIPADRVPMPRFLHLKGANPILGTTPVRGPGSLWRIRISEVGAFTLSTPSS